MVATVSEESPNENSSILETPVYPAGSTLVLLWLCAATAAFPLLAHARTSATPALRTGVDPNVAPWWELALLPRLGPAVAKEIVLHRTSATTAHNGRCVFHQAADLEAVKGIGPKTLLRVGPHLRFDSCLAAAANRTHDRGSPP